MEIEKVKRQIFLAELESRKILILQTEKSHNQRPPRDFSSPFAYRFRRQMKAAKHEPQALKHILSIS